MKSAIETDVLIVGAGPTGLMMASLLERHGVSYRLIDKKSGPSVHSKALGLQPRTLEVLDQMGIVSSFIEKGNKIEGISWFEKGQRITHVKTSSIESPFPFILVLPQSLIEQTLIDHLDQPVHWNCELIDFEQTAEGVVAETEQETIRAKWLLGCDGAHSTVRHHSDIPFEGAALPHLFFLADAQLDGPISYDEVSIFFHEEGILAIFPIDKATRTVRIVANLLHTTLKEKCEFSFEEVEELVQKRSQLDVKIEKLPWGTPFKVNFRMADQVQKGRVFLLGDAFHIHSPVGGQGMNTGMQDALNLSWKLALVLQGKSPETLLSTYTDERFSNGKNLLKDTEGATSLIDTTNPVLRFLRGHLLPFALSFKLLQKKVMNKIAQLRIQYPKNPFLVEYGSLSEPALGSRFPYFPLVSSKTGEKTTSFDLMKDTHFHLFLFGGEGIFQGKEYEGVVIHHIGTEWLPPEELPIKQPSLFLVRPDGYIAYLAHPIDLTHFESYFGKLL